MGNDLNGEWIFCNDRLPEDGENVLVWFIRDAWGRRHYLKQDMAVGWQVNGLWHIDGCSGVHGIAWMPLPKPPKEVKNG